MILARRSARRFAAGLAAIIFISFPTLAQLSGAYTIGGTSPDFPTFSAAVNALTTNGVSGSVLFKVRPGTYTEQIAIGTISGASFANDITFASETSSANDVILTYAPTSPTANYVLRLNNCSYVHFYGITFKSTSNGTLGGAVQLAGAVSNLDFQYDIFSGYASLSSGNAFSLLYAVDAALDTINVSWNTFNDCGTAISLQGLNSAPATLISTTFNVINNPNGHGGILLSFSNAPTILLNQIRVGDIGVELDNCDYHLLVSRNIIESGRQGIVLYSCIGTGVTPAQTDDNFIHVTGSGYAEGIRVQLCESQYVVFNSVNLTGVSSVSMAVNLIQGSVNSITVMDNILANKGGGYCYSVTTDAAVANSDYNDMVTTGPYVASWDFTPVSTLSALQSMSGRDLHSMAEAVHFVSDSDLHLTGASLGDIALRGGPVDATSSFYDIDGARHPTASPYVGADEVPGSPLSVHEFPSDLPATWQLEQNYPNPFNPSTTIRYALPHRAHVTLTVYNTLGQKVVELVNGAVEAGSHEVEFEASSLASGVYFYRLTAGTFTQTKKLMVLK